MRIQVLYKRKKFVIYVSIAGICLFTGLFLLLYILSPQLSTEDAVKRVRLLLQRELSLEHMSLLKASGRKLPDRDVAAQWEEEIKDIKNLRFKSVDVNRLIPDILFNDFSPSWVVRISIPDDNEKLNYRYFWLGWDGIDRETSRVIWFFSI